MFATVVDALTRPETFFEQRDPSLRSGLAIVLSAAAIRLLIVAPLLYLFRFLIPPAELWFVVGVTVVVMTLYALLRWLLLTALVYGAARRFGTDRSFRGLLPSLGWAHLPNLVGGVVVLGVTVAAVAAVKPPTSEAEAGRTVMTVSRGQTVQLSSAYGLVEARTGISLNQLQYVVGIGQFAWGVFMWFAAAKVCCRLDDRRALLAVALPAVVGLVVVVTPWINVGVAL